MERPRYQHDRDFSTSLARARFARNDADFFVSHSEAGTERIAARFACTLRGGEVVLLEGDLGAGKTVFVRGLAKGLGVRGRITSPTFVLMRVHRTDHRTVGQENHRTRGKTLGVLRSYSPKV
ncbi:MAG: tRNA (adenosine(37)-N6)-threonylcarbamoyltransferase complex ATPase subunit type 1 TsaE, partial [Candidatus Uhrbacteria bacterium]